MTTSSKEHADVLRQIRNHWESVDVDVALEAAIALLDPPPEPTCPAHKGNYMAYAAQRVRELMKKARK